MLHTSHYCNLKICIMVRKRERELFEILVVCYSLVGQLGLGLHYTWGGGLGMAIIEIGKRMYV